MAIRYPKGGEDMGSRMTPDQRIELGQWEELLGGEDAIILAVGRMVGTALRVCIELMGAGISCGVIDARFVKPMDEKLLEKALRDHKLVITLEDNVLAGGFGSGVAEWMIDHGCTTPLLRLGVPDRFIEYGMIDEQMNECGLDAQSIRNAIIKRMTNL